ncbi:MAG: hypothetical protein ABI603_16855 [Acidobacteriota bacterium]
MRKGGVFAALGRLLAIAGVAAAGGCGGSPITSVRIERAIAPTFANLVEVQLSRVGLPAVAASSLSVTASCRKQPPGGGSGGAGDWICVLMWHGPNQAMMRDSYDLTVAADGCYTAVVDTAEATLGGPVILGANGEEVKNLLYAFEGCFDTTPRTGS